MSLTKISQTQSFAGTQSIYSHPAMTTGCTMRFGIFLPPQAEQTSVPALYWLSGLTCTEENFIIKAGAQRIAAELGIAIITADTSPRGLGIPDEEDKYDFGTGAGFYVDATVAPWATNYRMYSYITAELTALVNANFPIDPKRTGIFGHSMGGHGALTIALKNPALFKSVSAFAPICSPIHCPWGNKALRGYLGDDPLEWEKYDATVLVQSKSWSDKPILIDQGTADPFMAEQLKPELFVAACKNANVNLQLRMQSGYDHSYFFIATFIEDHLRFHAKELA